MKRIIILGSTGSIGTNTLDVVRGLPEQFSIVGMAAGRRGDALLAQAREFAPAAIALTNPAGMPADTSGFDGRILTGPDAAVTLVKELDADIVVAAMAGAAGLPPVLAALETGKDVALANKETLVMAGVVVMDLVRRTGRNLLPVDSEHSAVFQSMLAGAPSEVDTIILTASGGALRDIPPSRWDSVTPEQALRHPNWNMGPKVTIDSASLMNKALEIIEAHWLFDAPSEKIKVLIHPQSIVHSMVQFCDGSVIAQMGPPDMRFPIQFALTYPDRSPSTFPRMNLAETATLTFREVSGYRTIDLAYQVLDMGGTAGAVFNAANEVAVAAFLEKQIKFPDITDIVAETLSQHTVIQSPSLEDIVAQDTWARAIARSLL